ncbi:EAL domain-containing protein [Bacillus sp. ISL-75]|uniref:EAL domain-containing protein n=1 Tax=Bacillus sp. ISL-75 TaxID=2819137 RepID=UPI0035ABE408
MDKSFIQGLDNKNQKSVCRALVAMGRNLGMNVVAEGVEEMEQYQYLCSIGCIKYKATILADPLQLIWWRSFSKWEQNSLYFRLC